MAEETTTRRKPLVPGPNTPASISERAIALREEKAVEKAPGLTDALPHTQTTDGGKTWELVPTGIASLTGAISSVMAEIGTIERRGHNAFHNYKYPLMQDIYEALTPLMGKHGLAIFQSEVDIKMEGNSRIAVQYDFMVTHKSGEHMPPLRQTGTAIARDSRGNLDDKAVAKAHTSARKSFICALFQIPAGEFPDNDDDSGNANQRREQRPVPGPTPGRSPVAEGEKTPAEPEHKAPQKIGLGAGAGVKQWARKFIDMIEQAASAEEIAAWDRLNDAVLQKISNEHPDIYETITTAVDRKDMKTPTFAMPKDTQDAMNWVATHLAQAKTYDFAEEFWNQFVAPRESSFDIADWEMLLREWKRTADRLKPPDDEPEQAA
jgi:hypothetical protein